MLSNVQAVQLTKFDYRFSNKLDPNLQKLRCRENYHALKKFGAGPVIINEMGKTLVDRMRMKSKHFIALHLRLEPDMLAFLDVILVEEKKKGKNLGKFLKGGKLYMQATLTRYEDMADAR
ncbi:unnamed protein product [Prunus brigantina]